VGVGERTADRPGRLKTNTTSDGGRVVLMLPGYSSALLDKMRDSIIGAERSQWC